MFHNIKRVKYIHNPGRHTYKAFVFLFFKVDSNDWFQKCTVKTSKTNISDIKILIYLYQNMFIDSLVLHVYSVSYFRQSCDFYVMS